MVALPRLRRAIVSGGGGSTTSGSGSSSLQGCSLRSSRLAARLVARGGGGGGGTSGSGACSLRSLRLAARLVARGDGGSGDASGSGNSSLSFLRRPARPTVRGGGEGTSGSGSSSLRVFRRAASTAGPPLGMPSSPGLSLGLPRRGTVTTRSGGSAGSSSDGSSLRYLRLKAPAMRPPGTPPHRSAVLPARQRGILQQRRSWQSTALATVSRPAAVDAPCIVDVSRVTACVQAAREAPLSPAQPGGWVLTELPPTERPPRSEVRDLIRGDDLPAGKYGKETGCLFVEAEDDDTPSSIGDDVGLPGYAIVQSNQGYTEFRTAGPLTLKSRFQKGSLVRVYGPRHTISKASAPAPALVVEPRAPRGPEESAFLQTADAIERIFAEQRVQRARGGRKLSVAQAAATAAQVRELKWEPGTRSKNKRTFDRYREWADDTLVEGWSPITMDKLTLFVAAYQLVDGNTARGARTIINSVHKWALLHHGDQLNVTDEQYTAVQATRRSMEAYDVQREDQALPMTADRIRRSQKALLKTATTAARRREALQVMAGLKVMYMHGLRGFTALQLQLKHWQKAGPKAYVCTIPPCALPKKGKKRGWPKQIVFWVHASSDMCAITALDKACCALYKTSFDDAIADVRVRERYLFQKLDKSWPVDANKPWHKDTVARKFRRAATLAGIEQAALVRLHSPRSGLVLDARRRGVDWVDVALILMHADPATTARYYYRADPRRGRQTRFQIMGWRLSSGSAAHGGT